MLRTALRRLHQAWILLLAVDHAPEPILRKLFLPLPPLYCLCVAPPQHRRAASSFPLLNLTLGEAEEREWVPHCFGPRGPPLDSCVQ